ncbi:MAG TPA: putative 2OG-Fe(II) oxygenase [Burkholderiales bacterium]|nr:putative 2OG-Fe(II) oxygenase [Burkholderiales bacterium]
MAQDRAADAARARRAVALDPRDRVSWHNLAAAEGDLGNAREAERAARRALELGIAAPETRVVLARALQDLNRLSEAERMFEEAIALRPSYAEAHRDLAQLRWMRTGQTDAALRSLDAALARAPQEAMLHLVRSIALEFIGDELGALASAEAGLARAPHDLQLLRQAAHLCAQMRQSERAVGFARHAVALAPDLAPVQIILCEALLACGDLKQAAAVSERICAMDPLDQHAVALRATTWRLRGDPRYELLNDYARLIGAELLDVPKGWSSLPSFLDELAADLAALHRYRAHPFQQSVRGGGQLPLNAREMSRRTLQALFACFRDAVQRHLARLGSGSDPFTSRNTGRFGFAGAWSVRLAAGGHHADHVHPRGWLSSAFYVALPPVIRAEDGTRAGWFRLGRPGIATTPRLDADHYITPEAGKLLLFPSYMWHGVEPFQSVQPRLTVAFDAVPQA